jgi:hypothetical protein
MDVAWREDHRCVWHLMLVERETPESAVRFLPVCGGGSNGSVMTIQIGAMRSVCVACQSMSNAYGAPSLPPP